MFRIVMAAVLGAHRPSTQAPGSPSGLTTIKTEFRSILLSRLIWSSFSVPEAASHPGLVSMPGEHIVRTHDQAENSIAPMMKRLAVKAAVIIAIAISGTAPAMANKTVVMTATNVNAALAALAPGDTL
ncbi:hypothetical protein, partial [Sandarakinorhabdus sp.]|uniref:hypothetical protein n=1 Tax=Sandarakinorhabdus sp. TaxID=1916663 RepID=UPI00334288C8